ncbi:MAG TPA: integrase core domain-containing protein [Gemmataceae bacterium]|nr:integrase core domain-containing protein [Gemmataceae bacterium]
MEQERRPWVDKTTSIFRPPDVRAAFCASIRLPPRSPNLNAYAERFVRSIKEECLDRMIFIGEAALRRAVREFMAHYHAERNHQGLGNRLTRAEQPSVPANCQVERRIRLGGMLSFYQYAVS